MTYIFLKDHNDEFHKKTDIVTKVVAMPGSQEKQGQKLRTNAVPEEFESFVDVPEIIDTTSDH